MYVKYFISKVKRVGTIGPGQNRGIKREHSKKYYKKGGRESVPLDNSSVALFDGITLLVVSLAPSDRVLYLTESGMVW